MGHQLTKKEITREILKCGKDPVYFINNYAKISHPMHGLVPFKLYDYQADLVEDFNDYRFNIILKARQLGISTVTAAYIAWMMIFHRDKNILVMATKFGTAGNLVKKVKAIVKHLPPWIRISNVSIDNRTSFELSNGSQIKASSTSGDAGRSEALSLLVIDEAAHVDGLDELWTGLYPTLSTGGRCIALSTPNGVGNWFHKSYTDSAIQQNDFHPTELMWDVHPDRDQEWFEHETRNMSRRQIAQELECNFNTSGETVVHPDDIAYMLEQTCEPKYRTGFDRNFWIWESYLPECTYLISADVARGDGKDYSVFHVFNLDTMEIIAEYQGKVTPDVFSQILADAGKEYGDCLVVVENNTVGFAVLDKLKEKGYPNVYHSIKSSHEQIDQVQAEFNNSAVAGFTTSLKTRPMIVAKMEEFVRNKLVKVYSSRLLNEFKTFIWNNGRPQAMRSYHDDLIMAFAIGCWVKDTAFAEAQRDVQYQKAILNSMKKSDSIMNTTISGMQGHRPTNSSEKAIKEAEKNKDFMWLFKG
tara:strand:- start:1575 stop:3161 length:1587 start_codon:yes stop_codon:yes gene_type:complete